MDSPKDSAPGESGQDPLEGIGRRPAGTITLGLLLALAIQAVVPPLATDMYTPAFPQLTTALGTTATLVGLSLTAFFVGMASGQILGGALSDQIGRRTPMIVGGAVCLLGSLVCMLAPNVWVLLLGRLLQGLGGGAANSVARAVLVDMTSGATLASTLSVFMAITGLAPMIAPVIGGVIVTLWQWRVIFAVLSLFASTMMVLAWRVVPESLPPGRRHSGGIGAFHRGILKVLRLPVFTAYMITNGFSAFCMFAYVSASSYILQDMVGMPTLQYSIVFAANALGQVLFTVVNSRLVKRFHPRRLMLVGLGASALSVALLSLGVFALGTPVLLLIIAFAVLMSGQAFIFGNSSAQALDAAHLHAGTASAVIGLTMSVSMAISAPLASSGGGTSAVPMVLVMIVGVSGAWISYLLAGHFARRAEAS